MNSKIILVLIIAGLGCLGFGLLVAPALDQSTIEDNKNAAIIDNSGTNVTLSTVKSFHLERNQKVTIKLAVFVNESSVTDDTFHMKIVSWKTWNASQNADPTSITGESYRKGTLTYPPTSISYTSETDFNWVEGSLYVIEFKGDTPSMTKPIPGDYRIILWSEDGTPDGTTLYYDFAILQDGLGPTLTLWFCIIGLILVGVGAVLGVMARKR